ncbi:MAG: hypothetical protein NVV82_01890 [Sporocytophaga sp.]|nr:hypothetical protein [Sporocytophaga sp.]
MLQVKHCLSLLFALFISLQMMAQVTFTASTAPLQICGESKQFSLTVTNGATAQTNYSFDIVTPMGVHISSPVSTNGEIQFPSETEGNNKIRVHMPSFLPSTSHLITFNVIASCSGTLGTSGNLKVSTLMEPIATFAIQGSSNGDLNLQAVSGNPERKYYSNINKTIELEYELKNTTLNSFTGVVKFTQALGSALATQSILAIYPGGSINLANGGTFNVSNLAPNQSVIIKHEVMVNSCLRIAGNPGVSTSTIQWGCSEYDLCRKELASTTVEDDGFNPAFTFLTETNYTSSRDPYLCYGTTANKKASWKNTGTGSAYKLMLHLDVPSNILYIPENSVAIRITKSNGIIIQGSVYRHPDNQPPVGQEIWTYNTYGWTGNNPFYLKDCVIPTSSLSGYNFSCEYPNYLKRLLITHFKNATGTVQEIGLDPQDIVTIEWEEVVCCYEDNDYTEKESSMANDNPYGKYGLWFNGRVLWL